MNILSFDSLKERKCFFYVSGSDRGDILFLPCLFVSLFVVVFVCLFVGHFNIGHKF